MKTKLWPILTAALLCLCLVFSACNSNPSDAGPYTVTFKDGNAVLSTQTVEKGEKAEKPADPAAKSGYIFAGWYKDSFVPAEFKFTSDTVNSDLTIYAKWDEELKVTVTFKDGGDVYDTKTVTKGQTVTKPENPEKDGYDFEGWYTDSVESEEFDFDTALDSSASLYARWQGNSYTVTYEYNEATGGKDAESAPVTYGSPYTLAVPTRLGFDFAGWYENADAQGARYTDGSGKSISNWSVTGNKTLHAVWTVSTFTQGLVYTWVSASDDSGWEVAAGTNAGAYTTNDTIIKSAEHIIIPATYEGRSVRRIAANGFENCYDTVSVTIPATVTAINSAAFKNCTSMTSITLPSVKTISANAFQGCAVLDSVSFPDSLTSIGNYAFQNCANLTISRMPEHSLTTIGDYAFENCASIGVISLPSSITSIGQFAFNNCAKLNFPSGYILTQNFTSTGSGIGNSAFKNCASIDVDLVLQASGSATYSLGASVFAGCTKIKSITLGSSVTGLGTSAFEGCTGAGFIDMSGCGMSGSIAATAFKNCSGAATITLPPNLGTTSSTAVLGANAFEGCTSVVDIVIPDKVQNIGATSPNYSQFSSCTSLKTVTFGAAYNDTVASNATPSNAQFYNCPALEEFKVAEGNTKLFVDNGVLYNTAKTILFYYPPAKKSSSYEINAATTRLIPHSFQGAKNLETITLPATVSNASTSNGIGEYAFNNCPKLATVILKRASSVTTGTGATAGAALGANNFVNCPLLEKIYVPDATSVTWYKQAANWSAFTALIEISPV